MDDREFRPVRAIGDLHGWVSRRPEFVYWSIVAAVTVVAAMLRVEGAARSLWLDEAWVANAVLEPSLWSAWFYDSWAQTEPPLFIGLTKLISGILGPDESSMRLIPVIAGVVAVPLMAAVARKFLPLALALAATVTLAFDPDLIVISRSAKQYSSSVLSTLLLLLVCSQVVEHQDRRSLFTAVGAIVVLGTLSYQSFTFVPTLAILILFADRCSDANSLFSFESPSIFSWARIVRAVGVVAICGLASVVLYQIFVVPNRSGQLVEYWSNWYPELGNSAAMLSLYEVTVTHLSDFVFTPGPFAGGIAGVVLAGWLFPWGRSLSRPWTRNLIRVLILGPVMTTVALNMAQAYPVGRFRLTAFLFPISIIGFWSGTGSVITWLRNYGEKFIPQSSALRVERSFYFGALCLLMATLVLRMMWSPPSAWTGSVARENPRAVARYLSTVQERGDVLYVHGSMWEQIRYYRRFFDLSAAHLVRGRIGWPCCQHKDTWWDRPVSGSLVDEEVERVPRPKPSRTLRLVFTSRRAHWNDYPEQDPNRFSRELDEKGCLRARIVEYQGVRVDEYECGVHLRRDAQRERDGPERGRSDLLAAMMSDREPTGLIETQPLHILPPARN